MHIDIEIEAHLDVYRLGCPEALGSLAPEWASLEEHVVPRTPFTSPTWLELWWRHLRRRHVVFRDEFFWHIVRDSRGRLVGIAPLMKTFCPGLGPAGMRMIQFFGCDPGLTELRGVICRPEDHDRVILTLAEHFHRTCGDWDVFRWSGLRQPASWYNAMPNDLRFVARRNLPDYIVNLPPSWDTLKAHVSSNMRRKIRKSYQLLERDGHDFALRVVERPEDVPAAMDRFLALHVARSDATAMIDHPNKFATPRSRAFLASYLRRSAETGEVRLFELESGGKVVASRVAFLLQSNLYLYYSGYDPSWRKYSIMTTLMCEVMKWAIDSGLHRVNLSTGTDLSKLRWKPEEFIFSEAVQRSPTRRGQLSFYVFRLYERLSNVRDKLTH